MTGEPSWAYSERFSLAAETATWLHRAQFRKGTTIPYVSHLFGTCAIALEYGANEDQAIAALLHDVIEDVEPTEHARASVAAFGPEVLRIVDACTDTQLKPKPPWRPRKEAYIASLATEDRAVLLVSASDKLHNARAIVGDLHRFGQEVWKRFNADSDQLWYYRALVEAFRRNPLHAPALIDELDRTVTQMELMGRRDTDETPAEIVDPVVLVRINKLYEPGMSREDLYEVTRGAWKMGERRNGARYALAVFKGTVVAVYSIDRWQPAGTAVYTSRHEEDLKRQGRWEFTGRLADDDVMARYLGRSVRAYLTHGAQNPIVYVNC